MNNCKVKYKVFLKENLASKCLDILDLVSHTKINKFFYCKVIIISNAIEKLFLVFRQGNALPYSMKVWRGEFGVSSMISQTKIIQIST